MFQMTRYVSMAQFHLCRQWVNHLTSHGIKAEIRTKLIKNQDHGRDYMRHHFAVFREGKEALWVPGKDCKKKVA